MTEMRADLLSQPGSAAYRAATTPHNATVVQRPVMLADIRSPTTPGSKEPEAMWSRVSSGGAKGTRTPALTRQNIGLPADSFRFVPFQCRSLPAVMFSGLEGVKRAVSNAARSSTGDRQVIRRNQEHVIRTGAV